MFDTESCFSASDVVQYVFFESELNDSNFSSSARFLFCCIICQTVKPIFSLKQLLDTCLLLLGAPRLFIKSRNYCVKDFFNF